MCYPKESQCVILRTMCYPKDSQCVILALGEPQIFILHLPPVGLVSVLKSLRWLPQAIYLPCTACLQVGRSSGLGEGLCPEAPPHLPPLLNQRETISHKLLLHLFGQNGSRDLPCQVPAGANS